MPTPTRKARCGYCEKEVENPDPKRLAFYEYRGPGSRYAQIKCMDCGYHECAHQDPNPATGRPGPALDHAFRPNPDGHEFDSFYCGCRGWD